ncbi:cytochrome-c peroxidase [Stutzerimonas azotifigens]|uniref:Cytochrome-c peroxidase n=1 Tax=Stutzerimonas azotifigens TaxID=291995 RepID=A0ABR5YV78_9GAMM|nr:cytochrome-c peroxidase [Stutzerimonas azotifigens]MBA1271833.1 cytochrome-c peroxidase [Stutzerimonas azotifigens]
MRTLNPVLLSSLLLIANIAQADALRERANTLFKPVPDKVSEVRGQPVSEAQAVLGHKLWFDPRLSRSHIISCNTCHNLSLGGVDSVTTSIGHGWQKGPRNSPTVLNSVFNAAQFWDGRAEDLQAQAKGPVQASVEMNNTPERVEQTLKSIPAYVSEFKKAFPKDSDPVSFDNMALAIEAFEVGLTTPNAPFDRYLTGDDKALSDKQKTGLALFMDAGCAGCHNGVNLGGQGYFPFGVIQRPGAEVLPEADKGRFTVTNTASDEYVFRAAPLRNVALTAPYFHSGEVWELEQAVAIMGDSQLGRQLDADEVNAITAFLHSLTGDQPQVAYPVLPTSTATTPKPE